MTATPASPPPTPPPAPALEAQQLFAGQREILITHAGALYRLRITRRNKLILQK
jgi:hemin uptake protein HemP